MHANCTAVNIKQICVKHLMKLTCMYEHKTDIYLSQLFFFFKSQNPLIPQVPKYNSSICSSFHKSPLIDTTVGSINEKESVWRAEGHYFTRLFLQSVCMYSMSLKGLISSLFLRCDFPECPLRYQTAWWSGRNSLERWGMGRKAWAQACGLR